MGKARKLIMKTTFRRRGIVLAAALVLLWAVSTADTGGGPASFVGTGWALLPPAVAIVLAFVTKEVYSSLLAGCVMGALLAEGFAPWRSFETLFLTLMEGIDRKIFFFDVLLGAIVVLTLGVVLMLLQINEWYNSFYSALQNYESEKIFYELLRFCGLAFVYIILAVYAFYLR